MVFTDLLFVLSCALIAVSAHELRIVQGNQANPRDFPYQVLLLYNDKPLCGGTLITQKHVLTAAHCVYPLVEFRRIQGLEVLAGSIWHGGGARYRTQRVSYSFDYVDTSSPRYSGYFGDIGVIHLYKNVTLSPYVQPISLPSKFQSIIPDETDVLVSGFGSSILSGQDSHVLKFFKTKTMSLIKCQIHYGNRISDANICTERQTIKNGTKYEGTCTGDSGGPIASIDKKILIGIISGGDHQCHENYPNVAVKISYYLDYINDEIKNYSEQPDTIGKNPSWS